MYYLVGHPVEVANRRHEHILLFELAHLQNLVRVGTDPPVFDLLILGVLPGSLEDTKSGASSRVVHDVGISFEQVVSSGFAEVDTLER